MACVSTAPQLKATQLLCKVGICLHVLPSCDDKPNIIKLCAPTLFTHTWKMSYAKLRIVDIRIRHNGTITFSPKHVSCFHSRKINRLFKKIIYN